MTEHHLKTWPESWDAVARGERTFEVRRADRDFRVGDVLVLDKWDPETGHYVSYALASGGALQTLRRRVSYVLPGGRLGIEAGYVALGLAIDDLPRDHTEGTVDDDVTQEAVRRLARAAIRTIQNGGTS